MRWDTKRQSDKNIRTRAFEYLKTKGIDLKTLLKENPEDAKRVLRDELNKQNVFIDADKMGCGHALKKDYYKLSPKDKTGNHSKALYEAFRGYFEVKSVTLTLKDFITKMRWDTKRQSDKNIRTRAFEYLKTQGIDLEKLLEDKNTLKKAKKIILEKLNKSDIVRDPRKMGCAEALNKDYYRISPGDRYSIYYKALYEAFKGYFEGKAVTLTLKDFVRRMSWDTKQQADENIRRQAFEYLLRTKGIDLEKLLENEDTLKKAKKIILEKLNKRDVFSKRNKMGCRQALRKDYYKLSPKDKTGNHSKALYEAFKEYFEGKSVTLTLEDFIRFMSWDTLEQSNENIRRQAFKYLNGKGIDLENLLKNEDTLQEAKDRILNELNKRDVFKDKDKMGCGSALLIAYYKIRPEDKTGSFSKALYEAFKKYFEGKPVTLTLKDFVRRMSWDTKEQADENIRRHAFEYLLRTKGIDLEKLLENEDTLEEAKGIILGELNNKDIFIHPDKIGCGSALNKDYYKREKSEARVYSIALYEAFRGYFEKSGGSLTLGDFISDVHKKHYGRAKNVRNAFDKRRNGGFSNTPWALIAGKKPNRPLLDSARRLGIRLPRIGIIDKEYIQAAYKAAITLACKGNKPLLKGKQAVLRTLQVLRNGLKGLRGIVPKKQYEQVEGLMQILEDNNALPIPLSILLGLEAPVEIAPEYLNRDLEFNNARIGNDPFEAGTVKLGMNEKIRLLLIHGVAGSGKTTTIVEIINQLVSKGKRVLVVSHSHNGVDNIMEMLDRENLPILRAYNKGVEEKVSKKMKKYWISTDYRYNKEGMKITNSRRIKGKGIAVGVTSDSINTVEYVKNQRFDVVIIDEAGKSNPMDTIIPAAKAQEKLILVGDHKQLEPYYNEEEMKGQSEEFKDLMKKSYLEKLMDKGYNQVFLAKNYRSHPAITMLVSRLFYRHRMLPKEWLTLEDDTIKVRDVPKKWAEGNEGFRNVYDETGAHISYFNPAEAEAVIEEFKKAISAGYRIDEITILSGYKAQVEELRDRLRNWCDNNLAKDAYTSEDINNFIENNVCTIDSYQGRENRVIIYSFVRSNSDGKAGHMGRLNRLNVSLTRAIDRMIFVCDVDTLKKANATEMDSQFAEVFNKMLNIIEKLKTLHSDEKGMGMYTIKEALEFLSGNYDLSYVPDTMKPDKSKIEMLLNGIKNKKIDRYEIDILELIHKAVLMQKAAGRVNFKLFLHPQLYLGLIGAVNDISYSFPEVLKYFKRGDKLQVKWFEEPVSIYIKKIPAKEPITLSSLVSKPQSDTGAHLGTRGTYTEKGYFDGKTFDQMHRQFIKQYRESSDTLLVKNGQLTSRQPYGPPEKEIISKFKGLIQKLSLEQQGQTYYFYFFNGAQKGTEYGTNPYCLLDSNGERLYFEAGSGEGKAGYKYCSIYLTKELFQILSIDILTQILSEEIAHTNQKTTLREQGKPVPAEKFEDMQNRQKILNRIESELLIQPSETFKKAVLSLISYTGKQISKSPFSQEQARKDVADALKKCMKDACQNKFTRSMAWHILEGIGANKEFKGRVIYSLDTLLESKINGGKRNLAQLKRLVKHTKGRVLFYAGTNYIEDPDYAFLKQSLFTKDALTDLLKRNKSGIIVFMLNSSGRKELGIDKIPLGKLIGNKFVVPIQGNRDVENDIFLGLEIMRNSGRIGELSSIFKMLLAEAIRQWLKANGKDSSPEEVQKIMQIPLANQYSPKNINDSYKYIKNVITSA